MICTHKSAHHHPISQECFRETYKQQIGVQRVTAAQLRLLVVLALELVADAVEQLHVALLRVLAQRRHEGVRHGAGRFARDVGVGPVRALRG